ncbi:hypothetical protein HKX48_004262 [Thoreauomyces humboldtii]|nr:hypothetical protein HKX48_004262 [Thoreauomyces humboldtii]
MYKRVHEYELIYLVPNFQYLPSLYLALNIVLFILRIIHVHFFIVLFGTLVAWLYTRFFKRQDGIKGDRSETFSFASFFPDFLQPAIKPVSSAIFKLAIKIKICAPIGHDALPVTKQDTAGGGGGGPSGVVTQQPPGPGDADAERRR